MKEKKKKLLVEEVDKKNNDDLLDEDFNLNHFSDSEDSIIVRYVKKIGLLIFEVVKVVLISLAIILPIRMFLIQPFYVEGASMEPNFYDKEYLIVNEMTYRFNEPQRGEVIVFKYPKNPRNYYIKRIIGLPSEKIEIINGKIYIDDKILSEEYIKLSSTDNKEVIFLSEEEYFVLGDNRNNSYDSRRFGPLKEKYIIGKVWFRGWPLERMATFNLPEYN